MPLRVVWIGLLVAVIAVSSFGYWAWQGSRHTDPSKPLPAVESREKVSSKPINTSSPTSRPSSPEQAEIERLKREALTAARRLVKQFPNNPMTCHVMGLVYRDLGNSDEAVKWWRTSTQLEPTFIPAYIRMAYVAMDKGQYRVAADRFRKALAIDPTYPEARLGLAEALMNLGQMQSALTLLQEDGPPMKPESVPALNLVGQIYLELHQYDKAKEYLEQSIQLDPNSAYPYHGLSIAEVRRGNSEQAKIYRKRFQQLSAGEENGRGNTHGFEKDLAAIRVTVARILDVIAATFAQFRKTRDAERLWLRAIVIDPTNVTIRKKLATYYEDEGLDSEVIAMLRQLCELNPDDPEPHLSIGMTFARMGRIEEAEKALRETIRLDPKGTMGLLALTQLYVNSDRKISEAVRLASKAVELAPEAASYFALSVALERNGDIPGALKAIEEAIRLAPNEKQLRIRFNELQAKQ